MLFFLLILVPFVIGQLPKLRKIDDIDPTYLKIVPEPFIAFVRDLTDDEKNCLIDWAYEYAEGGEEEQEKHNFLDNHTEIAKKMEKMEPAMKELTKEIKESEGAKAFVYQMLNTIGYLQAAVLADYQIETEHLKAILFQFVHYYNILDRTVQDKIYEVPVIKGLMEVPQFRAIKEQWMPPPVAHKSIYPLAEEYKKFEKTPQEEEEEEEAEGNENENENDQNTEDHVNSENVHVDDGGQTEAEPDNADE